MNSRLKFSTNSSIIWTRALFPVHPIRAWSLNYVDRFSKSIDTKRNIVIYYCKRKVEFRLRYNPIDTVRIHSIRSYTLPLEPGSQSNWNDWTWLVSIYQIWIRNLRIISEAICVPFVSWNYSNYNYVWGSLRTRAAAMREFPFFVALDLVYWASLTLPNWILLEESRNLKVN